MAYLRVRDPQCSAGLSGFAPVEGRAVVAAFDEGKITSDAGTLLLGATDRAIGLVDRFAACFTDSRALGIVALLLCGFAPAEGNRPVHSVLELRARDTA